MLGRGLFPFGMAHLFRCEIAVSFREGKLTNDIPNSTYEIFSFINFGGFGAWGVFQNMFLLFFQPTYRPVLVCRPLAGPMAFVSSSARATTRSERMCAVEWMGPPGWLSYVGDEILHS